MANIVDLRRTDLRTNVLTNPYWITSANFTWDQEDGAAGLFSFPITLIAGSLCEAAYGNSMVIIQEIAYELEVAWAGGTPVLTIGLETLDLQTTLAYTTSDPNMYVESYAGSGLTNTAGLYLLHATSAYDTDRVAMQHTTDYVIVPKDTDVPCVVAFPSSNTSLSAGSAYLHMLISVVPVVS